MTTASRAIGLLLLCCAGCNHEPLAVLVETQGAVERDFGRSQLRFSPAKAGARFDEGDGLRTLVSATALLRVGSRGQARVEGETTIRFRSAHPGSTQRFTVEVVAGTATLLSGTETLSVRTKSGEAILVAGSALRVRQSERGQRYEVVFGRASFPTHDGKRVELGKGQVFEVEIGLAELAGASNAKTAAPKVEPEVVKLDAVVMQPVTEAAPAVDGADGSDYGLDYAEVVLRAGTSATIYDPKPPTAVGLDVASACPKGAVVRAGSGKRSRSARGFGQVNLALPAGAHTYRVSCLGQDSARAITGMVFVLHKSGADSLPRTAPTNSIDLDGRRYTVMFQNLPPAIDADWPKAPKADHYVVRGTLASGKALALTTRDPSYRFGPGEIPEGENHLYFEAAAKDTPRSRETTVVVKFDNAAPTASLRLPAVDGFVRAPSVEVEGVALPSSTVSVNGQALALDAQHRFTGSVPLTAGAHALSVRIDHPRIGVRYYIRRPKGAP